MQKGKYIFIILSCILLALNGANAQSMTDLKRQQKKLQQEMEKTNKMLQQTKRNETATLNKLELIGKNIETQRKLINNLGSEIHALDREMTDLSNKRDTLQSELERLKENYAELVRQSHYAQMKQSPLLFLLASKDFNQLIRRMRYLQEFARYRQEQVGRIENTQHEIDIQNQMLQENKDHKRVAMKEQQRQQDNLTRDEKKQQAMLSELKKKEKDLAAQQQKQQKRVDELNKKIEKLVREQAKKQATQKLTKEQELLAGGFKQNKGRLPWPVENGVITGHFGKHKHPVYELVTVDNKGIYIQATNGSKARAVYDGQVSSCFVTSNTYAVIIQHGTFRTVYAGLSHLNVKQGDNVKAKQNIGTIYSDPEQDNKTELYFQIYEDKDIRNPELWLSK